MDKMREEFEVVYNLEFERALFSSDDERRFHKSSCWWAWQASRQALVVDVESLPSASYTDVGVVYRSHVESMIESAGVSLK